MLVPKRVELMHEVVPNAELIAVLLNPDNPNTQFDIGDLRAAEKALGVRLEFLEARTMSGIEVAFASILERRAGALIIGADPLLSSKTDELAALATRYHVPAIAELREFVVAGGLMAYETDIPDAYRLAGNYTGRILRGEKPAELPVQQTTKARLILNLRTAKALGLTMPPSLVARADEVIESR
jgi:putative ABC transport system substrate-binding protein